jgi:hypothetical protein
MEANAQIIADLRHKIGPYKTVDLLSNWKGVPVVVIGHINEVREESIVFRVEEPDSISFAQNDKVLILQDIFIMAIQARVLSFNPHTGLAKIGKFAYTDRGFGGRSMVRVEPENPIQGKLVLNKDLIDCQVIDISLNGFGITTESIEGLELVKGQAITIQTNLLDQGIEITGTLVGVFHKNSNVRLAMSFPQDAPNHGIVTRYIARRRVEIRREILAAYQQAVGEPF